MPVKSVAVAHESAYGHVSGRAHYLDDIATVNGTLHIAPVLSQIAHGTLIAIDAQAALAQAGVVALITADDIPGDPMLGNFSHDEPILASGQVLFAGQVVALIVAQTHEAARLAAALVRLQIDPLPAVLTIEQALQQQSYVLPPVTMQRGDPQQAIASARHQLHSELIVGGQEHFYLEGQIAYALPQEQGSWLIYSSTQHPGEVQHWVAHALGLSQNQVRVECRRMGGGFGGKETQAGHLAVWATLAAHKTGRPVKFRADRDDDMLFTGKRHNFAYRYQVGFDDTGLIKGLAVTMASQCGYSADLSGPVNDRAVFHLDNAYFLEHLQIESFRCKTHTQSNTAFRGFGGPQGMILIETVVDDIAHYLGIDALAVRRRNLYQLGERNTTHYGMELPDNVLPQLFDRIEAVSRYRERRTEIARWNALSPILKRGLALTPVKFGISFTATQFNQAGALIHIYSDGTVQVNHGGTEMGQGLHTKIGQIVAETLAISVAKVMVTASDTSKIPNASATAASAGTDLNGRAAQAAAAKIVQRLIQFAAERDQCAIDQVRYGDASISTPTRTQTFAELVSDAYQARVQLWSDGFYKTPKIHYDKQTLSGRPFFYFAYGASCSEVVIDTLTGETKLLAVDIVHDVGQSINPAIDIGQIEGGFVQGMGWLTSEELFWDQGGRLRSQSASTYKIPTAADVPEHFKVELLGLPNPEDTIHRSKAVGEPPLMLAISVFAAIRDAIANSDYRSIGSENDARGSQGQRTPLVLRAPATPEAVLTALNALQAERR